MLKNMTRKGLALGTGLALVATGFVAAPAQATATGLLWSAYGQSNEMVGVMGHDFTLRIANPAGITIAAGTAANATGIAEQTAQIDDHVVVTVVPKAGQTASVVYADANASSAAANAAGGVVTVQLASAGTLTGATAFSPSGLIGIGAPSNLTTSLQVDVYVVYEDGSRSETERITFVPKDSVSTSVALAPVAIGASADITGNSFSFSGINTGNFIQSNFTGGGASGAAVATKFGTAVTVDAVAKTSKDWTYVQLTDVYTFTYTSAIAAEDVIIAKVNLWDGAASVDANVYFDADATATEAKFTVSAAASFVDMDIAVATSASVVQNKGTATSLISAETVVAEEGTKTLNFTLQLYTDAAMTTAAGANHAVTVTLTDTANGLKTTTITSEGKSLDVTGTSISFTKVSNSSGQIAFSVTANNAVDGESFTIDAAGTLDTANALDTTTVKWQEAAWTLLPAVDGNFTIAPKGSIAVDYTVVNQFGALANADYQLTFTRAAGAGDRDTVAEYANWSYVAPVSATGRASVTIVDNGAAVEGSDTVTVALQKKASSGTGYIAVAGSTDTFTLTYENDLANTTVTASANYNGIANAAGTTIEPLKLETKTLVDYDSRLSGVKPVFATDGVTTSGNVPTSAAGVSPVVYADGMLRIFGTVRTAANQGVAGVAVKLSGTGANFADKSTIASANLMKNDSIVVFTDATGSYEAFVRSSVAGTQTISVDAQGKTSSVQVRFQDSTGVATAMTLTMPSSVNPGARADIVAKVVDKFGKPVSGVTVNFKDNGPGVLNASSAVTDIFGEAMVTLTTVAAESGTTTVTAYATIAGKNEVATKTITVGSAAGVAGKVNVGSFNGKLVVYASGLSGSTISWKVGGNWGKGVATSNYSIFNRPTPRAGVTVSVDVYVNGVKTLTKSVVTR